MQSCVGLMDIDTEVRYGWAEKKGSGLSVAVYPGL